MNKKHKYTPLEALDFLHCNCDYYPNKDKHWEIVHTALKALEILKDILHFKVVQVGNEERLFVKCGNFKASIGLTDEMAFALLEALKNE